ncbi:DUF445 domain-containing protein [Nakamurella silvestris]|nr:DUF445 domain-containing protein [Nakamurella silvestris]
MKLFATALLVLMAVIFVIAWNLQEEHPWLGYVRAAAEAGMVGALADWFAVTALFRKPLGLPIPHTAIIPERKNDIGASLSEFVATNFLSEAVVREKLAALSVAGRAGEWLSKPESAARVTHELATAAHGLINVLRDEEVAELLGAMIREKVEDTPLGPPLGRVAAGFVARGEHHWMVDFIVDRLYTWIESNPESISRLVEGRAPSWTPRFVDHIVSDRLLREVETFAFAVKTDKAHPIRLALDKFLGELADDLQHDPESIAKVESLKHRILANPDVQGLAGSAWKSAKKAILRAVADPQSQLRVRVNDALLGLGRKLVEDRALAAKIDTRAADAAGYLVANYARDIAGIIDETVAKWDGEATSRKIELMVGRDLQFIRINGTVVGALAGLAIYTFAHLVLGG